MSSTEENPQAEMVRVAICSIKNTIESLGEYSTDRTLYEQQLISLNRLEESGERVHPEHTLTIPNQDVSIERNGNYRRVPRTIHSAVLFHQPTGDEPTTAMEADFFISGVGLVSYQSENCVVVRYTEVFRTGQMYNFSWKIIGATGADLKLGKGVLSHAHFEQMASRLDELEDIAQFYEARQIAVREQWEELAKTLRKDDAKWQCRCSVKGLYSSYGFADLLADLLYTDHGEKELENV